MSKTEADTWKRFGALNSFVAWTRDLYSQKGYQKLVEGVHKRREWVLKRSGPTCEVLVRSAWRCAIGLGNPSTFENSGVSWEQSYGFPIIPAASLKGLLRHYLEQEYDPKALGHVTALDVEWMFGSPDGDGKAGVLEFLDGWPLLSRDGWFDVDVLTAHHRNYYGAGQDNVPPPADTEDPNPVHFLTLRMGVEFKILVTFTALGHSVPAERKNAVLGQVKQVLFEALDKWGIGGKTGAGYGRFIQSI